MPNIPTEPLRVAVLACSISDTIAWLSKHFEVREINGAHRRVTMKNGDVYIVVTIPEHARACEFHKYIIAPSYYTLEDEVKTRIRPFNPVIK
jgi:hypothetical protein